MNQKRSMKSWVMLACFFAICAFGLPLHAQPVENVDLPGRPSDEELLTWMNRPVLENLSKVGYIRVSDANFEREVLDVSGPTMVLFATDVPTGTLKNASRGMGAIVRALKTIYPELRICLYMVNQKGLVTTEEFTPLIEEYELRNVPTLIFYSDLGNYGKNERHLTQLEKDIIWEADVLYYVDYYSREYFPESMLRKFQ